jgi:HPt (histidine-containing phosphotransfer) domain-containing protein
MREPRQPRSSANEPSAGGAPADPFGALGGVFDAQALERLKELDPHGQHGLLPRVLAAFDASLERLLGQLAQARSNGDDAGVRHVAHTLKSSAASVGALELSRICADIERRVREQQSEGLPALLDDMVAESRRVRAVLVPVLHADR